MTIEDELKAMLLMSSLPPSWETFVTTVCNVSAPAVKYSEVTSSILAEVAQIKSFVDDLASDTYVVWGLANRLNIQGRSSSWQSKNARNRSKSRDNRICNDCKKPGHIKADSHALKFKNDKAQRDDRKGGRQEEVNFVGLLAEVLRDKRPEYIFYREPNQIRSSTYN